MSVDLSVDNGLAEIVLNRPDKMNALSDAMVAELNGCVERAASQGVRAMMIRGEGPAFCAGRDLADAHPGDEDAEAIIETTFNPLMKRIVAFPAPTFAAVHGACRSRLGIALDATWSILPTTRKSVHRLRESARCWTPAAIRFSSRASGRIARSN